MATTTTAVTTTAAASPDVDWNNNVVIAQSVFGGIGVVCCLQVLVSNARLQ